MKSSNLQSEMNDTMFSCIAISFLVIVIIIVNIVVIILFLLYGELAELQPDVLNLI